MGQVKVPAPEGPVWAPVMPTETTEETPEVPPRVGDVLQDLEPVPVRGRGRGPGFAGMDPDRLREVAALGGRRAHERQTAHRFTRETARDAGRKGGQATASRPRPLVEGPGDA